MKIPVVTESPKPGRTTENFRRMSSPEPDSDLEKEKDFKDARQYPGTAALALLTLGLCMATFTVALDNTIIATAIPKITTVFNSLDDVGWYGSSYLLTTCALQPSFGKVYTYFNIKFTFTFALVTFEAGSVICATASSSVMLIVGRSVAGAGAAGLFSGGMTIIGFSVPLGKRAIYIAALSSMFGIASIVGPILGGVLTDKLSWRWCFWINLPFGAVAMTTVFFCFKNPKMEHDDMSVLDRIKEMDVFGAFFLITSIVCVLLALQWGGTTYPWSDPRVWGCLLGFGLLIIPFIYIQYRRGERATLPPRILLKQRTVLTCSLFATFLTMASYIHIFYLPIYFQAVKGTSAEGSGTRTIPYLISSAVSSLICGAAVTVLGYYAPFMWAGTAIFVVGCGMLYTLQPGSSNGTLIGSQVLAGFGAGACKQIPFIAVQTVLSEKDMPVGTAIAIFFSSLGGAIPVSIAQNIFQNTLTRELRLLVPEVNPLTVINAGATHIKEAVTAAEVPGVLEAYSKGITSAFLLSIVAGFLAFLCSCGVECRSVKAKGLSEGKTDMSEGQADMPEGKADMPQHQDVERIAARLSRHFSVDLIGWQWAHFDVEETREFGKRDRRVMPRHSRMRSRQWAPFEVEDTMRPGKRDGRFTPRDSRMKSKYWVNVDAEDTTRFGKRDHRVTPRDSRLESKYWANFDAEDTKRLEKRDSHVIPSNRRTQSRDSRIMSNIYYI